MFPVKTSELAAGFKKVKNDCIQQFKDDLMQLEDNAAFNKSFHALLVSELYALLMKELCIADIGVDEVTIYC